MSYELQSNLMSNSSFVFEENLGQQYDDAKFTLKKGGYTLFFLPDRITIGLIQPLTQDYLDSKVNIFHNAKSNPINSPPQRVYNFINILFTNCNNNVQIVGENKLISKFHYMRNNLPSESITNVNTYNQIRYLDIYPNIDLLFYSNDNLIEYDFIVKPNANLKNINLTFEGIDNLNLNNEGNAILSIKDSTLKILKPNAYQIINNNKQEVTSEFILNSNALSISVAQYDISRELIIDPILFYSTYLGGNSGTYGYSITSDSLGNAYVTGYTTSSNLPITNPIIGVPYNSSYAAFVSKFDPSGNLLFSTYINGSDDDYSKSIAVDSSYNIYITGNTYSGNTYPSSNYFGVAPDNNSAVFITKLDYTGSSILYSAYIHGDNNDDSNGIAIDSNGNAYITGYTTSGSTYPIIPDTNIHGSTPSNTVAVFVTKLSNTGQSIVYSSYIHGDIDSVAYAIATDLNGSAYVTGYTNSGSSYPLVPENNYYGTAPDNNNAIFITKLSSDGLSIIYSAYIHGNSYDYSYGIAVDTSNNAYITGYSYSQLTYPIVPVGNTHGPVPDTPGVIVTKINATGRALLYSTYISGSSGFGDGAFAIAIDSSNNAYVTGLTFSNDYPTTNFYGVTPNISGAIFITQLNPAGDTILYSAYINGSSFDFSCSISVDQSNNFYITGYTDSSNFPTVRAFDSVLIGNESAVVMKFITDETLLQYIYNELTSPTYGLEEIKTEVFTIENSVLDSNYGLQAINNNVNGINNTVLNPYYGLQAINNNVLNITPSIANINTIVNNISSQINNPSYGLQEIKSEIFTIEDTVLDSSYGLQSISTIVNNINYQINNPKYGLEEIKAEVFIIEGGVYNPNYGLQAINSTIDKINSQINNSSYGLEEIKAEVRYIEKRVDCIENLVKKIYKMIQPKEKPSYHHKKLSYSISSGFIVKNQETRSLVVNMLNKTNEYANITLLLVKKDDINCSNKAKDKWIINLPPHCKKSKVIISVPEVFNIILDNVYIGIEAWVVERTCAKSNHIDKSCYINRVQLK